MIVSIYKRRGLRGLIRVKRFHYQLERDCRVLGGRVHRGKLYVFCTKKLLLTIDLKRNFLVSIYECFEDLSNIIVLNSRFLLALGSKSYLSTINVD
jgi:hypothetical protein